MRSTPTPSATDIARRATARAARDTAYLTIGLLTSSLAFTVWVVGISISLSLIVGLPVAAGTAIAFRWTAELDRRNAAWLLGRPVRGRYRDLGRGLRGLLSSTLGDAQTWRDVVWLVLHSVLGFVFGCLALGAILLTAGLATLPAWYWSLPDGRVDFGPWHADSTVKAFVSSRLRCRWRWRPPASRASWRSRRAGSRRACSAAMMAPWSPPRPRPRPPCAARAATTRTSSRRAGRGRARAAADRRGAQAGRRDRRRAPAADLHRRRRARGESRRARGSPTSAC